MKLGAFYIATGRDAVLLQSKLNLKCTCFKDDICKVGIPVNSIEKYLPKLDKIKYSYIIYDYNKNEQELKVKYEKNGKCNKITEKNLNCIECKGVSKYKEDEYMLAVEKLLQSSQKKGNKKLTYESLMKAHYLSRKGKGYRKEIILFNMKQEEYILWLYKQLENQTYRHGGYIIFYVTEPKLRRIEKSRYIDRIVHRWVVDSFLNPHYLKTLIPTTYACIKERGMHKASLDLQKAMLRCKRKWGNYYILKMDIKKFFDHIDKDILLNILKRKIKDKKLLWLLEEIIYSNCSEEERQDISLKRKGMPIGNYTSQTFANIYLNELDQYIKHKLKCKYYFRYMDDGVVLLQNKQEAKES